MKEDDCLAECLNNADKCIYGFTTDVIYISTCIFNPHADFYASFKMSQLLIFDGCKIKLKVTLQVIVA